MPGDMPQMRVLHQRQVRKMRMLSELENKAQGVELPRRKVVKKKRKRILSGLMVGPIDPKCWEAPSRF
jgi:hypothetical protein